MSVVGASEKSLGGYAFGSSEIRAWSAVGVNTSTPHSPVKTNRHPDRGT